MSGLDSWARGPHTVVLPHLFGESEAPATLRETSPVADWLRSPVTEHRQQEAVDRILAFFRERRH